MDDVLGVQVTGMKHSTVAVARMLGKPTIPDLSCLLQEQPLLSGKDSTKSSLTTEQNLNTMLMSCVEKQNKHFLSPKLIDAARMAGATQGPTQGEHGLWSTTTTAYLLHGM